MDTECGLGSNAQGSNANDELSKESTLGIVAGAIVLVLLLAGLAAYFVLARGKKSSQTSSEVRPGFENRTGFENPLCEFYVAAHPMSCASMYRHAFA